MIFNLFIYLFIYFFVFFAASERCGLVGEDDICGQWRLALSRIPWSKFKKRLVDNFSAASFNCECYWVQQTELVVHSSSENRAIVSVACGGGHRSYAVNFVPNVRGFTLIGTNMQLIGLRTFDLDGRHPSCLCSVRQASQSLLFCSASTTWTFCKFCITSNIYINTIATSSFNGTQSVVLFLKYHSCENNNDLISHGNLSVTSLCTLCNIAVKFQGNSI